MIRIISGVCKHAVQILREGATNTINALNVNSIQLATDWQKILRVCKWATKPGIIGGFLTKRTFDILLSANNLTDCWDMALIIGEHKPRATLRENRKAITQQADYAGKLFGV